MADAVGNLAVVLSVNNAGFAAQMAAAGAVVNHFSVRVHAAGAGMRAMGAATPTGPIAAITGGINSFGSALGPVVTRVASFAAGLATMGAAAGLAGLALGVKLAADFEQAQISFTTMLGSADKATALLQDIQKFAAATPFESPELIDASRKLLAFGTDAESIIPTLQRIGDISAGIGAPIGEIAELYGKAQVQGRLFAQDINQLTGRGIPIIAELAKQFGVAESEVRELVESGTVNFSNLETAFVSLTSEGGKFSGLMAAQSQSLLGLWSTLKDNIGLTLQSIAESLIQTFDFKGALASLGVFAEQVKTVWAPVIITAIQETVAVLGVMLSGFHDFGITGSGAIGFVVGAIATLLDIWDMFKLGLMAVDLVFRQAVLAWGSLLNDLGSKMIQVLSVLGVDTEGLSAGNAAQSAWLDGQANTIVALQKKFEQALVAQSSGERFRQAVDTITQKAQEQTAKNSEEQVRLLRELNQKQTPKLVTAIP